MEHVCGKFGQKAREPLAKKAHEMRANPNLRAPAVCNYEKICTARARARYECLTRN
jgi:hypothetical protein